MNGIATFDNLIPLVPSVYITNPTTGAPYVAGYAVHPRVCCALVYRIYTAEPGLATTIISNPFHTFRECIYSSTEKKYTEVCLVSFSLVRKVCPVLI